MSSGEAEVRRRFGWPSRNNAILFCRGRILNPPNFEKLDRGREDEHGERGKTTTAAQILAFAEQFATGMTPGSRSGDHAEELYDDDGMPRVIAPPSAPTR